MSFKAVARFDFDANEEMLSFKKGETLKVFGKTASGYWAEINGKHGLVLERAFEMVPDWFYGRLKRGKAERILSYKKRGAFLVRSRETGGYTLSVNSGPEVRHFRVQENARGVYFIRSDALFDSIIALIKYYASASICETEDIKLEPVEEFTPKVAFKGIKGMGALSPSSFTSESALTSKSTLVDPRASNRFNSCPDLVTSFRPVITDEPSVASAEPGHYSLKICEDSPIQEKPEACCCSIS